MAQWKERYESFDKRPQNWEIVAALVAVAKELDRPPSQVALAWLLAKPVVTAVIFGARTVKQLEENVGAAELGLSQAHEQKLDDASHIDLGYPYDFMQRIDGRW